METLTIGPHGQGFLLSESRVPFSLNLWVHIPCFKYGLNVTDDMSLSRVEKQVII